VNVTLSTTIATFTRAPNWANAGQFWLFGFRLASRPARASSGTNLLHAKSLLLCRHEKTIWWISELLKPPVVQAQQTDAVNIKSGLASNILREMMTLCKMMVSGTHAHTI